MNFIKDKRKKSQSWQFNVGEPKLGNRFDQKVNKKKRIKPKLDQMQTDICQKFHKILQTEEQEK